MLAALSLAPMTAARDEAWLRGARWARVLLAPYVAIEPIHKLITAQHPGTSVLGIIITALSLAIIACPGNRQAPARRTPELRRHRGRRHPEPAVRLPRRAVLAGLAANAWLGWWWLDPLIGLAVAAVAIREGLKSWRGEDCC